MPEQWASYSQPEPPFNRMRGDFHCFTASLIAFFDLRNRNIALHCSATSPI